MNTLQRIKERRAIFSMNFGVALIPVIVVAGLLLFQATGFGIIEPTGDIDPRLPLIVGAGTAAIVARATGTK